MYLNEPNDFIWPSTYVALHEQGLLNRSHPDDDSYLWLTDMRWLTPESLRDYETLIDLRGWADFVLFASNPRGDVYAFPRRAGVPDLPVIYLSVDGCDREYYAPTFDAALFRQILECATLAIDDPAVAHKSGWTLDIARQQLASYHRMLSPYFPSAWTAVIDDLLALPPKTHQPLRKKPDYLVTTLLTPREAADLLALHVPWDKTDEPFDPDSE